MARKLDVLGLVARGHSNAETAAELVGQRARREDARGEAACEKLELRDRVQAVVLACESGLVRPGDAAT